MPCGCGWPSSARTARPSFLPRRPKSYPPAGSIVVDGAVVPLASSLAALLDRAAEAAGAVASVRGPDPIHAFLDDAPLLVNLLDFGPWDVVADGDSIYSARAWGAVLRRVAHLARATAPGGGPWTYDDFFLYSLFDDYAPRRDALLRIVARASDRVLAEVRARR